MRALEAAPRDGGGCSSVEYNPTICFWVFACVCVCCVPIASGRCAKGFKMRGNTRRVLALAWARVCLACMCVFCVRVRVRCGMWMGVLDFEGGEREGGERESRMETVRNGDEQRERETVHRV